MTKTTQAREVSPFDRIELHHSGELHLTQGDGHALTIEGDAETVDRLKTEVRGGTLHLEVEGDWLDRIMRGFLSFGKDRVKYNVTLQTLRALKVSGYGKVVLPALTTDQLELTLSGYAQVDLGQLSTGTLKVTISGRGDLVAQGSADNLSVFVSGSGDVRTDRLASKAANVRISGHGNVDLWASDTLDVSVSGFGKVHYRGDPAVSQSISGGGRVAKMPD